jgi:hypothetical protein
MRKSRIVLAATSIVAVGLLVLAGGLMASNMGFKLNLPLKKSSPGVSASGTNYISLPYNAQVGMLTAKDLFLDIQAGGEVQFLNQHTKVDDSFAVYTFGGGTAPPNGWTLQAGEAYIAKVGADQNYIIVGSHNPGLTISLFGSSPGVSASGTNYYSHPYHGVAANAKELFLEIGGDVQFLNQHTKVDDSFAVYTFGGGTAPPNGWNLVPGEGYIVKIGSDQDFVPAHY